MATSKRRGDRGRGSVYRQPGSPYWYMSFFIDGKRFTRSTGQTNERLAWDELDRQRTAARMEYPEIPAELQKWTFGSVASQWLTGKLSSGIQNSTKNELRILVDGHLIPAFNSKDIHKIRPMDIQEFMSAKLNGRDSDGNNLPVGGGVKTAKLSASYVRKLMQTMDQIFSFAQVNGFFANSQPNPVRLVDQNDLRPSQNKTTRPNAEKVLSRAQIKELFDAAQEDWEELLYRLMVQLGLRVGEAFVLTEADYDRKTRILRIRRTQQRNPNFMGDLQETDRSAERYLTVSDGRTKTNAGKRQLKVGSDLHKLIVKQLKSDERKLRLAQNPESENWLLPSKKGTPLAPGSVRKNRWTKAVAKAGLSKDVTFHTLRHTFASLQIHAGVPIAEVSRNLGHKNPQVTLTVYTHILDDLDDPPVASLKI